MEGFWFTTLVRSREVCSVHVMASMAVANTVWAM